MRTNVILKNVFNSPRSTFVIDSPRRGVLITRTQSDDDKYFMKLRTCRSSVELVVAAAEFLSISEDRHDDDDELLESRRSLLIHMQLLNMVERGKFAQFLCSKWML